MISKLRVFLFLSTALTLPALSQANRTWVSGVGDDANPCSRTAPCKTFAGSISKTAAGGEIDVLDPGDFGVLTITKAITIDGNTGAIGSLVASGLNGIVISAGSTDTVILRNLSINGVSGTSSPGINGVYILNAGTVHIENTKIFGFGSNGINFASSSTALTVVNSQIENITGTGIAVSGSGNTALLKNVAIFHVGTGITASDGTFVTARSTDISKATSGVIATSTSSAATISLDGSSITGTNTAVQSNGATSMVALNDCTFNNNGAIFTVGGGTVGSYGNNRLKPGAGTVGPTPSAFTLR